MPRFQYELIILISFCFISLRAREPSKMITIPLKLVNTSFEKYAVPNNPNQNIEVTKIKTIFGTKIIRRVKEELIDIFKTYIFKLMNMDIESLIQEQINNDRENIELHKKYKDFFTGKVDSILKINNLYKSIKDRTEIIKNAIDEKNKLIANTKKLDVNPKPTQRMS